MVIYSSWSFFNFLFYFFPKWQTNFQPVGQKMSPLLLVLFFQITNKCRTLYSSSLFFLILPYQRHFKQMIIDVSHLELPSADFFKLCEGSLKAMPKTLLSYCISTSYYCVHRCIFMKYMHVIKVLHTGAKHWHWLDVSEALL